MDSRNDTLEYTAGFFNARTRSTDSTLETAPVFRSARNARKYYAWESYITVAAIVFTMLAWSAVTWETVGILWRRVETGDIGGSIEQVIFIAIVQSLIYGNFLYQFARLGYLRRRMTHRPRSRDELEALYEGEPPTLAILVPSYKEEIAVVRKTLLSAALQEYPNRRVVLLVDDPPQPGDAGDRTALEATLRLPGELQRILDGAADPLIRARDAFLMRAAGGYVSISTEAAKLARLYEKAATYVEAIGARYPIADHSDELFMDIVVKRGAAAHRARARALVLPAATATLDHERIEREYQRLATLFAVDLTSFERKRYANLSHEPNKAMNLNSYIRLLGGSWQQVRREDGVHLEPASAGQGTLDVAAADFLITLDADSLIRPEYALVLINEMRRPGNERLAVAQTPYNTIPNPPNLLERIAGATTDIQYLMHQGFTRFNATYWVGANALLRVVALQDIRTTVQERGIEMPVFIQDRTVIEDTESSIDLVAGGWKLFNYPERLAFSATPPDFGSLLIQRRRWANGGVIIVPKLLRYLAAPNEGAGKFVEGFFRFHYLGSIAMVNIGLLILLGHSFDKSVESFILPLTALPYFLLYTRDLRYSGYRVTDILRVYALNLLLIPVNLGGVLKSLQQVITGRRTPFGRTPKVSGRTAVPTGYLVAEYALLAFWLVGCCFDIATQRWASAVFVLANALMLAYAIRYFLRAQEA
jgi:cellulose synthase/poly-beta-1,6-N-acetylglucosamine synthase-like glycosyltransferase